MESKNIMTREELITKTADKAIASIMMKPTTELGQIRIELNIVLRGLVKVKCKDSESEYNLLRALDSIGHIDSDLLSYME